MSSPPSKMGVMNMVLFRFDQDYIDDNMTCSCNVAVHQSCVCRCWLATMVAVTARPYFMLSQCSSFGSPRSGKLHTGRCMPPLESAHIFPMLRPSIKFIQGLNNLYPVFWRGMVSVFLVVLAVHCGYLSQIIS